MPVTSFKRIYAEEILTGRARLTVEMGLALYKAAKSGSVAGAKGLLQLMERSAPKPEPAVIPNRWDGLIARVHGEMANSDDSQEWRN
jgi:hypothetical protein